MFAFWRGIEGDQMGTLLCLMAYAFCIGILFYTSVRDLYKKWNKEE